MASHRHNLPNATDGSDSSSTERPSSIPSPHEKVRLAITSLFKHDKPWIQEAAMEIALAAHPWPDEPVSSTVLEIIAAEILPARNLQHHDALELAVDRLLRIAEALQHEGQPETATQYFQSARRLQDIMINNDRNKAHTSTTKPAAALDSLLINPLGTTLPPAPAPLPDEAELIEPLPNHNKSLESLDTNRLQETFALLQGAAAAAGSSDLGVLHGEDPTGIAIDQIADVLGIKSPLDEFDNYIDSLESRNRDIATSRIFTLNTPDTLEQLADRWGVTRERIRQKEGPLKEQTTTRFTNVFTRLANPLLGDFTRTIIRAETLRTVTLSLTARQKWGMPAAAVITEILGPWRNINGWAVHPSMKDRFENLRENLENAADNYNILTNESANQILAGVFMDDGDQELFLAETLQFSKLKNLWVTKKTQQAKVMAALQYLGHPATKEDIAELLDITPNSVGSVFGVLEEIVRFDRYRWAFKDWTDDPYDGIVGEITQRIDKHGGEVPIAILLEELPRLFQVTESSVRSYLATDAFTVEKNRVRIAKPEDYVPQTPESRAGAIQINGIWGQQLRLFERHFSGHSLGVSFDIAYANGLRPGDDLLVPVVGHQSQASLIWRSFSTSRRIDVGRVSSLLESSGYVTNDEIIVLPTPKSVKVLGKKDFPDGLPLISEPTLRDNSSDKKTKVVDKSPNPDTFRPRHVIRLSQK